MSSLLDLVGLRPTVPICGVEVEVTGVSVQSLVALMQRFSEVGKFLSSSGKLDKASLFKLAPREMLAALIAAGTGMPGNKDAEKIAAGLTIGEQTDLIDAILRQTFPRGIGPFVEKLRELGIMVEVAKASAALSPDPSKLSSEPATIQS